MSDPQEGQPPLSVWDEARYRAELALAATRRVGRLAWFGFELLVLSRMFERPALGPVTAALLHGKSIDLAPPELTVERSGQMLEPWTHGFSAIYASLFLNLRNPDALSRTRYALPAPPFRAIYLWDSAFIAQVWKWWDPTVAWDVLHSVLHSRDGDRLRHYSSEFGHSKLTQPPLLAWSFEGLGAAIDWKQHTGWLSDAYASLSAYHAWLYAKRQLPNGLFAWEHAYESGVENSPRFSTRDERRLDDTRQLAAPDFSAHMVLHGQALAAIAEQLGKREEAERFKTQAQALRDAVNEHLWDEREGLYFDRHLGTGAFVRRRTIASLMPLWAGIPDQERAKRMCAQIMDPDAFNTLIPFPTVALDDASFERDMWRGPVWVNTAFAVLQGLVRYGFHREASELGFRLCDGVYRTYWRSGHFYEFYDPTAHSVTALHRKRGNRWKKLSLGTGPVTDFVGWTGLVNTIVIEQLFGLKRTARGYTLTPRFPEAAAGLSFKLNLPLLSGEIALDVLPTGAVRGQVQLPSGTKSFHVRYGERVAIETVAAAGAPA